MRGDVAFQSRCGAFDNYKSEGRLRDAGERDRIRFALSVGLLAVHFVARIGDGIDGSATDIPFEYHILVLNIPRSGGPAWGVTCRAIASDRDRPAI